MKSQQYILRAFLSLGVILLMGVGCTSRKGDAIHIGFIGPLTGDAASFGQRMLVASKLAVSEAALGNVEIIARDDAMDVATAESHMASFLNDERMVAVIAAGRSQVVNMEARRAKESGMVVISPTATAPELSGAGGHFFRVIPSDAFQGRVLADYAMAHNFKRFAIAYLMDDYGTGLKDEFERRVEEVGDAAVVVASEGFRKGTADFEPLLRTLLLKSPEAIFVAGMPQEIADLLIDAKKLKVDRPIQFLAPEVFRSPDSIERAGGAAEGVLVSGTEENISEDFVTAFQGAVSGSDAKQEVDAFAANAYDAARAIMEALKRGAGSSEEIGAILRDPQFSFTGATGVVAFDPNGDIETRNYSLYVVRSNVFERVSH